MEVHLTRAEAEILIAVLTGAEASFQITNPPLVEALAVLRPWRSALIGTYLREMVEAPPAVDAVGQRDESPDFSTRD